MRKAILSLMVKRVKSVAGERVVVSFGLLC
jgi:hypothetical protein